MPKLSFMKWFPGDWLRDTRLLSGEGKGAWIDILSIAWNEPERGVYHRVKDDFCRELQIAPERYDFILKELAKVGDVMIGNDSVTIKSRRMVKLDKHYKLNANRVAKYRSNAKVTQDVTDKTLDVRRSQDVRLLKTTAGEAPSLSLSEYVNGWKRREEWDRKSHAAEIAEGLKKYRLGFRVEEEMYSQIMSEGGTNGTTGSKSIFEQVAERRRKMEAEGHGEKPA